MHFISFILILIFAFSIPVSAATPDSRLTVNLKDGSDAEIEDLQVSICQIAQSSKAGYYPAAGFEDSGISIAGIINQPSDNVARDIQTYVMDNEIACLSEISENGQAAFSELDAGIWLVFCQPEQGYYFEPFIVFLPQVIDGEAKYEVSSSPKTEVVVPDAQNIYLVKQWDDDNDAAGKRPDSVTIHLLKNGAVIDTVALSKETGWAYTFEGLSVHGVYEVEEVLVEDYSATYSGDVENGFVIINTYTSADGKLPQTGQLWWPMVFIAVAGTAFVVLGIVEVKGKRNENKSS